MNRLAAWLATIRGSGWFRPSQAGGFPVPATGTGWFIFLGLIAGLVMTILVPPEPAMLLRIVLIVGYIAMSYWTLASER